MKILRLVKLEECCSIIKNLRLVVAKTKSIFHEINKV